MYISMWLIVTLRNDQTADSILDKPWETQIDIRYISRSSRKHYKNIASLFISTRLKKYNSALFLCGSKFTILKPLSAWIYFALKIRNVY